MRNPVTQFLPERFWNRQADWFAYLIDYNLLAASASASPGTFTVETDYDFLCTDLGYVLGTTATIETEDDPPPVLVRIFDTGSSNFWVNLPTDVTLIFGRCIGTGPGMRPLSWPRFVQGGSTVTVEATNNIASTLRLQLLFAGVKISRSQIRS